MTKAAIITVAVLVALARPAFLFVDFNHHIDQSYQAIAHGLVLALLAVGYTLRWLGRQSYMMTPRASDWCDAQRWLVTSGWLLTAVEVVCGILVPIARKFVG